ncbi:voltage-gated chloride channel protein [Ilyomonas limi]|uniref:Voltage-gated chloride channel protein n=1 Tax=Ilyomonas limi TaxID=2575867 RepID=A0A4U3LBF2_9BACT|nr:voltage-gated chloride channel family protein [Ilyomonas limi]TKK71834.1 voltage-gated chloride channel protein [Ilyomonas limi]
MNKYRYSFEQVKIAKHLLYWTALIIPIAIVTGSLVALFLWLLDWATATRWQYLWLIFLLPFAGLLITFLYKTYGKNTEAGNNLIMDEIHKPGGGIPFRMAPLVLFSTIVTHLFGGSAGREGTAVQMGGSIASLFSKWYKLKNRNKRILLMCGMAAGFGAVFGTPITGAIFAMEVLAIGSIKYDALIPCLIASILADITCAAYGIHHTRYNIAFVGKIHSTKQLLSYFSFDFLLLFKVIVAGAAFGLASYLFAETSHIIKDTSAKYIHNKWITPIAGAALVIGISYLLGTFDYLGLGVSNPTGGVSILAAFHPHGADTWSWLWKLILTAITLSTGFKGGEVTPLFFIGATLGNTLATISGSPVDLFAGLGFIAVFAGATNTPLACTLMGVELFGSNNVVYYAVACFTAYYFSGHSGIYGSQRVAVSKFHLTYNRVHTIKEMKQKK